MIIRPTTRINPVWHFNILYGFRECVGVIVCERKEPQPDVNFFLLPTVHWFRLQDLAIGKVNTLYDDNGCQLARSLLAILMSI